jgi:hypothetical protein
MTCIIMADFEERKPRRTINLLDEINPHKIGKDLKTVLIEPGGIVQLRYQGRKVGIQITKAAAHEFVGKIISFENSKDNFAELTIGNYISFKEENIFGYDHPAKN